MKTSNAKPGGTCAAPALCPQLRFTPSSTQEWPGNVRELENVIERAIVLGSDEAILPEDLPEAIFEAQPQSMEVGLTGESYQSAILELKKKLITSAVREAGGNYTEAARRLGVNPTYLHRLIRNLNLKADL